MELIFFPYLKKKICNQQTILSQNWSMHNGNATLSQGSSVLPWIGWPYSFSYTDTLYCHYWQESRQTIGGSSLHIKRKRLWLGVEESSLHTSVSGANMDTKKQSPAAAAAAAKLLQSCPTLCDPIDGLLPGSSVPGILQATKPYPSIFLNILKN